MSSSASSVLSCQGLTKTFSEGRLYVEVLKGVELTVSSNELIAITGTSGSGKSTLLHLLGALDRPTSGSVSIVGNDVAKLTEKKKGQLRNQYLGFVYQFHHLLPEFNTVENVGMPLLIRGLKPKWVEEKAKKLLDKVELSHRFNHRIGELSGGERQRVAIARALVTEPVCVLADEPTGNLDNKTAEHVFELMLSLNNELQTSFIVVTHDLDLAARMQRTFLLQEGVLS